MAPGIPWVVATGVQSLSLSSHDLLSLLSLIGTLVIGFRALPGTPE